MPFDQPTRNRLARFVADARSLLSEEFTRQLQHEYGMDPGSCDVADLAKLGHLDDARRETARILRATLAHYLAGAAKADKKARQETLARIVREQAYTVLNRLAALRMAEARGLLIESVGRGYRSRGFQLYAHLAGPALGDTGAAYRSFLFSLFDELAVELPALFDRFSPQGRLFPREASLLRLLDLLNTPDLEALWGEDETLGWIYQYFNSSEERRQMRAESQAPRNSRELAVRNQFFTPRYVVEFLTDNTLGRIWYEMTQGRTALAETCRYLVRRPVEVFLAEGEEALEVRGSEIRGSEGGEEALSQEELLRQPVYISHRPLKDPREIKLLDPACGSMHFGLYAFDLFERIYEEAWDLEASGYALLVTHHAPLHADYPTKEAFSRAIPRLIIEHNIHGIDIDPRAVQIAGLSLWLRAQRSWQARGVKPQDRPRIQRSHIVCAEPIPGDKALLEGFLAGLRADRLEGLIRRVLDVPATQQVRATERMADALCDLVRVVWDEMKLAGEAGSLLKIEETLANAVRAAEAEWSERMPLFRVVEFGLTGEAERVRYPRGLAGEEGADFWQQAEALVLAALHDYAEQAQNGAGYQRRLFASDAARGFAFVDVCRKRYDIVLMNPPFGEGSSTISRYLSAEFAEWTGNLLCASIIRADTMLEERGFVGVIFDRTAAIKNSYEAFRRQHLDPRILCVADTGWGVLDANVETTVHVIARSPQQHPSPFFDVRSTPVDQKATVLVDLVASARRGEPSAGIYLVRPQSFLKLPNAVVGYYFDAVLLRLFDGNRSLGNTGLQARQGHALVSTEHFRLYWEIEGQESLSPGSRYALLYNGAEFSLFAVPSRDVTLFGADGAYVKHHRSVVLRNPEYQFLQGIGYGKRGDILDAHVLRRNSIFTSEGQAITGLSDSDALLGLAYLNSSFAQSTINQYCGQHKHCGYVNLLPFPLIDKGLWQAIIGNARELVRLKRFWFGFDETALEFQQVGMIPTSLPERNSLTKLVKRLTEDYTADSVSVKRCLEVNDELFETAVSLNTQERTRLSEFVSQRPPDTPWPDMERDLGSGDYQYFFVSSILSHLVGSVLGRWDIRIAISGTPPNEPSGLLDPIPIYPPGMLQDAHGLPAAPADVPADYPLRISWPGILVDDPGHPEDIEARVRDALRVIWPDNHDAIEQEACQILGVGSLREYFGNPGHFFDDHLKRYSKSRRAAPIYWPLSTASGSYTLWLYYHRLSDQTLYWCVNDFVEPRLRVTGDRLTVIRRKANRSREEERELEQLSQFEIELREFRDELLRVAAFWRPNLNDGVQITAAPLWRLFRHRAWQRRLKETWEQLEAGDYDWAHLALSIWPARVVPKCVTDRSLAIAHDLEEVFWVEDPPGSWRNLRSPDEELEGLVAAQRSPARERLAVLLAELARGRARGLRCAEVWDELAAGRWDDLEASLLLWPERVAEACWDDPLLAVTLQINLPTKRTKAARERFVKERVAAGCADLAAALEAALRERPDRFASFWSELARGDHDHLRLALALWPVRVVATCAADVELADGHDVRRFLWVREGEGLWRRRKAIE